MVQNKFCAKILSLFYVSSVMNYLVAMLCIFIIQWFKSTVVCIVNVLCGKNVLCCIIIQSFLNHQYPYRVNKVLQLISTHRAIPPTSNPADSCSCQASLCK